MAGAQARDDGQAAALSAQSLEAEVRAVQGEVAAWKEDTRTRGHEEWRVCVADVAKLKRDIGALTQV